MKIKYNLSSLFKYRAPMTSEQSHHVVYRQIYRRTCVCTFQIYKFTVQCTGKCASLETLQLGLVSLLTMNTLMSKLVTQSKLDCTSISFLVLPGKMYSDCMYSIPGSTFAVIFLSLHTFLSLR